MNRRLCAVFAAWVMVWLGPAWAETCGGTYKVQPGDSLSVIANEKYDNAHLWTEIYRNNLRVIGDDPDLLLIGQRLELRCINGRPGPAVADLEPAPEVARAAMQPFAPLPLVHDDRPVALLTADGFPPFSDRSMPGGGMLTEIVSAAMEAAMPEQGYRIHWVNDRASHLEPLLSNALLDMGFPWKKPDCALVPQAQGCNGLLYSDPVFEALVVVFADSARPLRFERDADLVGLHLCRPAGFDTHDLDQKGRHWLRDGRVTLSRPDSVEACFEELREGRVDAVVLNEFTGRATLAAMGLEDQVEVAGSRPLSIETLHVVVDARHAQAAEMLNTVNEGLRRIRETGQYQAILDRQLDALWAAF